jgi:hypothetical protein
LQVLGVAILPAERPDHLVIESPHESPHESPRVVITAHHIRFYLPIMNEAHAPAGRWQEAGCYELRLKGHLETRWAAWFDGLSLTHESDGTTTIRGPIVDQAALHGVLQRVRDLGLPLVSVAHVDPEQPAAPIIEPR